MFQPSQRFPKIKRSPRFGLTEVELGLFNNLQTTEDDSKLVEYYLLIYGMASK